MSKQEASAYAAALAEAYASGPPSVVLQPATQVSTAQSMLAALWRNQRAPASNDEKYRYPSLPSAGGGAVDEVDAAKQQANAVHQQANAAEQTGVGYQQVGADGTAPGSDAAVTMGGGGGGGDPSALYGTELGWAMSSHEASAMPMVTDLGMVAADDDGLGTQPLLAYHQHHHAPRGHGHRHHRCSHRHRHGGVMDGGEEGLPDLDHGQCLELTACEHKMINSMSKAGHHAFMSSVVEGAMATLTLMSSVYLWVALGA